MHVSAEEYNQIVLDSEESPLTPFGIEQIEKLADHFQGRSLPAVHTSPLRRARQTADILSGLLQLPVVCIDRFREFMPAGVQPRIFPNRDRTIRSWFLHSMAHQIFPVFPVSESIWQARSRYRAAWNELLDWVAPEEYTDCSERLVTAHRGTVMILMWTLRWNRTWKVARSDVSNGGITEIIRE